MPVGVVVLVLVLMVVGLRFLSLKMKDLLNQILPIMNEVSFGSLDFFQNVLVVLSLEVDAFFD